MVVIAVLALIRWVRREVARRQEVVRDPPQIAHSRNASLSTLPQSDELHALAMMLAAADEGEQSRMLAPLPEFVVAAWSQHEAPALRQVHRVLAEVAGRHAHRTPAYEIKE
jgi:hypothetical protein